MRQRRMRRRMAVVGVLVLLLAAVAVGGLLSGGGGTTAAGTAFETEELAPALAAKLAANATFVPQGTLTRQEGDRGADDEFVKHAAPGDSVPAAAVQQALADWKKVKGRATGGKSDWTPLGPTHAQGLDNQYRDRSVYNAGTPDFSGRIAHVAIDPNCRANGQCTPLDRERERRRLAHEQRARRRRRSGSTSRTASSTTTRRRSSSTPTTSRPGRSWSAPASPTPAARGCEAGVGIYKSDERRQHLGRPARPRERSTAAPSGSIAGQAGRLEHDLRGLGPRRPRRLERLLRRRGRAHPGRAALRPLPLDERRRVLGAREPGRYRRSAPRRPGRRLAGSDAVLAARRPARDVRSGRPEHRLRLVLRPGHLAVEATAVGTWEQIMRAARRRSATTERAEFDVVQLAERRDADVRRRRRRRA